MKVFRLLAACMLMIGSSCWAQTYPEKSRPIRFILPSGPGSSGDIQARALARGMSELAGVTAIVENKPGAEGIIGMQAAKSAPADGYNILLASTSFLVLNTVMLPNLPYDAAADFVPLATVSKFSLVLNTGPSLPFKTMREFIEAARKNPGKYSYASGTTTTRLAMEMVERQAGIKLLAVPFKSMTEATTALASGQVDLLMNDVATAVPHYQTGRLRPLAVTGSSRMYAIPNVPTLQEEGLANYELSGWWALYFPGNTPPAMVATMREIVRRGLKTQYVQDALKLSSFEPLDLTPAEMQALLRSDTEKWGSVVRESAAALKK